MSRREQIRLTASEQATFLAEQRTVICATLGPRGWPHLMPLWYVVRDGERELIGDLDVVSALGAELMARYGAGTITPEIEAGVAAQAPKRVAMRFVPERTASWDHRQLADSY